MFWGCALLISWVIWNELVGRNFLMTITMRLKYWRLSALISLLRSFRWMAMRVGKSSNPLVEQILLKTLLQQTLLLGQVLVNLQNSIDLAMRTSLENTLKLQESLALL